MMGCVETSATADLLWECGFCIVVQEGYLTKCTICDTLRPLPHNGAVEESSSPTTKGGGSKAKGKKRKRDALATDTL